MAKAQQHPAYKRLPLFLRSMREAAGFTQRDLGKAMRRPQSWVYNCETANRRVDLAEFIAWCEACGEEPEKALGRFRRS